MTGSYGWVLEIRLAYGRAGYPSAFVESERYPDISMRRLAEEMATAKLVEHGLDVDHAALLASGARRDWAHTSRYLDKPSQPPGSTAEVLDVAEAIREDGERTTLKAGIRIYEDIPRWRIAAGALIAAAAPNLGRSISFCDEFRRWRASHVGAAHQSTPSRR
ncbi:hypothetical protein AB0876_33405 [Mycobacterium sp. NPDC049093]